MIFFMVPYSVDVPFDRKPVMNWLLVISVIVAFGFQIAAFNGADIEQTFGEFMLDGWGWKGLIGHMWLHADPIHLGGNMLFLWLFGNAVCAKVGNLKFIPIYLMIGLGAAASHLLLNGEPAVGASGAINGIVGMFLIFFWQNEMDCVFFMLIFLRPIYKTFSISSYWMIGLWLIFDILGVVLGGGQIAYFAHLGGFFAGAVLAVLLLKFKLVTMYRDEQSLVGFIEEWKQSRQDEKLERIAREAIQKAEQPPPLGQTIESEAIPAYVQFVCQCGQRFKLPVQKAGQKGRCPQCQESLVVPMPGSVENQ